jgi:hypothetical protein
LIGVILPVLRRKDRKLTPLNAAIIQYAMINWRSDAFGAGAQGPLSWALLAR